MLAVSCIRTARQQFILVQDDWIGLKQLDQQGKVTLEECPGPHMHVTLDWFHAFVIKAHLQA